MSAPLNILKVIYGAFAVPWANRAAFARKLAIPFLLLVLLGVVQTLGLFEMPVPVLWGVLVVHALVFVVFAVSCHRLVLLDPAEVARTPMPGWTWRETRFLWRLVLVWFLCLAIGFACAALAVFAVFPWLAKVESDWIASLATPLFMLPMFYFLARLSLVLPAAALDRRVNLGWAWDLSEGNSWRLFVVVGVLPWILSAPAYLVDYKEPNAIANIALTTLGAALLIVEIAALSLAYRELSRDEPATG